MALIDLFSSTFNLCLCLTDSLTATSRKEAERKRDEAKLKLAMGVNIGNSTTVKELADLWLHDYKRGEVRESTLLNLERILNCHILPELGRLKVSQQSLQLSPLLS